METTIFRQLANLITVEDICSPILATFDCNRPVAEVNEEWDLDLCMEKGIDPMGQIALTKLEGKIVGWLGFDMLTVGKKLHECADPLIADKIMSANTPLLEAVKVFSETDQPFYFILKGNQFRGWLSYQDFHKLPFRLCLYALLINLEKMMLDIVETAPSVALKFLPQKRLEKAREVYKIRGYQKDKNNKEDASKLLECTMFIDKITILRKCKPVRLAIPALDNKLYTLVERLRNELAHPSMEEQSSILLPREQLVPFINWAEEFEKQMKKFLDSGKALDKH